MKTGALTLLILGLVVESLGYAVDKADVFQFVPRIISLTYAESEAGLAFLQQGQPLNPLDPGFSSISEIFKDVLREQNPPELVARVGIVRFVPREPDLDIGPYGVSRRRGLAVYLSNNQKVEWDLEALRGLLDEIRQNHLTRASILLFLSGVVLQIIGFIVQAKGRKSA